jgi:hypothetical protein
LQDAFSASVDCDGKASKLHELYMRFQWIAASYRQREVILYHACSQQMKNAIPHTSHSVSAMEPQPSTGPVKEEALSELEATEREMAATKQELKTMKNDPTLIKLRFNDPTLSDITIKVGDKVVHLHRIVLIRGSEYFSKCLAKDKFKVRLLILSPGLALTLRQEGGLKEIKLQEDDPEALMAILRHLYGLPYSADLADWDDGTSPLPHAMVYTTADKYQITSLKIDSYATMKDMTPRVCKPCLYQSGQLNLPSDSD